MHQEEFVVLVICGHGQLLTEYTGRKTRLTKKDIPDIKPIFKTSSAKLDMISFAAPTEKCSYSPDGLENLKTNLGELIKRNPLKYFSASGQIKFKTAVKDVQELETFGMRYRSNEWAMHPDLNATQVPNYVENHYIGYKYPDKRYDFDDDTLGVFLVHTNVAGLPEMDYHEFLQENIRDSETAERIEENYLYLSDIIDYFNSAGINKIYIMDATCSVIAKEHQFAAENILRILKRRLIRTRKQLKKKERTRRISENPFSSPGASPASATTLSPTSPTEDTLTVVEVSPL